MEEKEQKRVCVFVCTHARTERLLEAAAWVCVVLRVCDVCEFE